MNAITTVLCNNLTLLVSTAFVIKLVSACKFFNIFIIYYSFTNLIILLCSSSQYFFAFKLRLFFLILLIILLLSFSAIKYVTISIGSIISRIVKVISFTIHFFFKNWLLHITMTTFYIISSHNVIFTMFIIVEQLSTVCVTVIDNFNKG